MHIHGSDLTLINFRHPELLAGFLATHTHTHTHTHTRARVPAKTLNNSKARRDSRFYVTVRQTRFLGLGTDRKENTTFSHKRVLGTDTKEKATPLLYRCPATGPEQTPKKTLNGPQRKYYPIVVPLPATVPEQTQKKTLQVM
jgi:hypothetical protein